MPRPAVLDHWVEDRVDENEGRLREWIKGLFSRCELIVIRPLSEQFIKALTGNASDV